MEGMESKVCFYWKFIFGGVTSYMICCKDFFFLIINYSFCGFGFWVLLDFFISSSMEVRMNMCRDP